MVKNQQGTIPNISSLAQNTIDPYHTIIRVLGTGGAGNNTIHHLKQMNIKKIETIAVNTDAQDLLEVKADKKILIGRNITGGLGAGGDPEIGERAAEESKESLIGALEETDMLFLTCGLGGGTGTGSAPVIGRLAMDQGILTTAIVTMPFSEEGIIRWENAQVGLEKLRKNVDTLIVLKNDRLMELFPNYPISKAFHAGDHLLINSLVGISELILKKGLINLDFADVSMVMRDGPNAVIGVGESDSENRVEESVRKAITHPMMEIDISGAQSALIHIMGGSDMTLKEASEVVKVVAKQLDPSAKIIWGTSIDTNLKHTIKVMLIASGLQKKETTKVTEKYRSASDIESIGEESEKSLAGAKGLDNGRTIFDIKESILSSSSEISTQVKTAKPATRTTFVFYKIFEEEAIGDLKRFDRAIHILRNNPDNRRALLDAKQSCKLIHASAQMFGFDEIGHLLSSIEQILICAQSKELQLTTKILDSITLAMEMVVDLIENRSDGKGETGYIVDRLKELKEEQLKSSHSNDGLITN